MRHLPLYLLLTVAAGCTLPALVSSETVPDGAPAAVTAVTAAGVKVATAGRIDLTADRGCKIFIKFLTSPELTAAARTSLVSSGFELVGTHEQADVVYELDGIFQTLRPATRRTAEVRVGGYTENPAPLATKSGRGGSVMLSLSPLAMPIGAIVSNVGNATDAWDSMNAATAGDPDGKYLSHYKARCYRQRNVADLTRKGGSTE